MKAGSAEIRQKIWLLVLYTLAAVALGLWVTILWPSGREARVIFLDVGQGDSILIETPHGRQVLIDGGSGGAVLDELGNLLAPLDRELDMVVLTHAHDDHVGGLIQVLDRYRVERIVQGNPRDGETSGIMQRWEQAVSDEEAEVIYPSTSMVWDLGDGLGLRFYVPTPDPSARSANHHSLVIEVQQDGVCKVLLTGDLESEGEQELLDSNFAVGCAVYKAGHHGSKYSNTTAFLSAIEPHDIVISAGEGNSYGHPHEEALLRFGTIPVYRTDTDGRITVKLSDPLRLVSEK